MNEDHITRGGPQYNLAIIRELLLAAFTAEDLERFCQDRSKFRFIVEYFGPGFDKMRMVDAVLEQCRTRALLPDLLAEIQEVNPGQYEGYSGQLLMVGSRQRVVNLRPLDMSHTFKDREREMQLLREYLADERVRLVSVVGRGGMGKTALVCHVVAKLEGGMLTLPDQERDILIDGILYLSARSTGLGLERIYADVRRMVGEPAAGRLALRWRHGETSPMARVGYLLEALQNGVYLVLLDNLENHITEEGEFADESLCAFVQRCLTQPSGARLIVTSRKEARLPAAALPRARTISLQEGLPEDDASYLLRELDPQGRLGLRDAPEEDLRHASQLTQGIPRALELVAGILDRDPAANLTRLLADKRLFGEQVVEALVAEGYTRLGGAERRVMEALAVLNRPIEEKAISFLLRPWFPGIDTHDSLRRLVSGYFVRVNRLTGEYHLHPLDREYAYSQLGHEGVDAYTQRNLELRAAEFYVRIRKPKAEWKTIDDLAPQLAEFEHRICGRDYAGACQVLDPIEMEYLHLWGHYAHLVEMRNRLFRQQIDLDLQANNLIGLAVAHFSLGAIEQAIEFHYQALSITRQIGDQRRESIVLGSLGSAYRALGQVERGTGLHKQALSMTREIGDQRLAGVWSGHLGHACYDLGRLEHAQDFYQEALAAARSLGDRRRESSWLGHLGIVYRALDQIERAFELHEQALAIALQIDYRRNTVVWLNNLGTNHLFIGQAKRGMELYEEALTVAREIGYRRGESYQLLGLARCRLWIGESTEAERNSREALALEITETGYQAALVLGIALLYERSVLAREAFDDAVRRSRNILDKTAELHRPRYALATSLLGRSICDSRWTMDSVRTELLTPVMLAYRQALENCSAPGVVQDALHDVKLIRTASIKGLEPVFELLETALGKGYQARNTERRND